MKSIYIKKCADPRRWYSKFVGGYVPYLPDENENEVEYKSVEPKGHVNFVLKEESELHEVSQDVVWFWTKR